MSFIDIHLKVAKAATPLTAGAATAATKSPASKPAAAPAATAAGAAAPAKPAADGKAKKAAKGAAAGGSGNSAADAAEAAAAVAAAIAAAPPPKAPPVWTPGDGKTKDMSAEMAQAYLPKAVESGWYDYWSQSGYFTPDSNDTTKEKFVVMLPPPNVTGYLHLGHALTTAVQDTLVRWNRMKGRNALYLPGTDHAGIATQVVVEKRLKAATGKSRHDFGREAFLQEVWKFKHEHAGVIQSQLRFTGGSLDWSRECFTLDEPQTKAVTEAFVRFHEDGLIHRATRLVNWCCALQSAISDLEVEMEEVEKNAKFTVPGYDKKVDMGQLTQIAYKFVGMDDEIIIATTRPETLLGDTAVAVHPDDPRYKKYHGMKLQCPFRDAQIPLVLDNVLVDMAFGTGAVKITPAHDPNDFECGNRHGLPQLTVIDPNGHISQPGPFFGMHRFECRKAIVKALEEKGLLRGVEGYTYRVGRCSRTGDIVEPMLMPQWFVDCTSMAKAGIEAVEKKELKIMPEAQEAVWFHWLKNIQPWCISRQLWWGHRIPAYKVLLAGAEVSQSDPWIVARNVDEARTKAQKKFNLSAADTAAITFDQDPDVLDTWFSSGLWPFSTLGWPAETPSFKAFFPGTLLETGHDILFFWVARMVMMSLHLTKQLPFTQVYLHAMVRDKDGRKMSKSLGNVIDPLDVIFGVSLDALHAKVYHGNLDLKEVPKAIKFQKEAFPNGIPECGSDALRFGLLTYTQSGRNVNLDIERVVGYRAFCNKLWNVVRYILFYALGNSPTPKPLPPIAECRASLPLECAWILSRLDRAVEECNRGFTLSPEYDFALATNAVYRFWLYELCDVFLELTKPIMQRDNNDAQKQITQSVLLHAVETGLRLLHPMLPFVTEELWHRLPNYKQLPTESIMIAAYPEVAGFVDERAEERMKVALDVVHALRSMKANYQLTNKERPDVWIVDATPTSQAFLSQCTLQVQTLAVVGEVTVVTPEAVKAKVPENECGFVVVSSTVTFHMMLKGLIDVPREAAKLQKVVAALEQQLAGLVSKMADPNYNTKVPANIRAENATKKTSIEAELVRAKEGEQRMRAML